MRKIPLEIFNQYGSNVVEKTYFSNDTGNPADTALDQISVNRIFKKVILLIKN